ncbi:MAG: helix-hairpin-helix domain-containing protein [Halobacteriales archaeon]|nr:helix-hairpin-helix domain-containing protein [Halobacteriales archaeon]
MAPKLTDIKGVGDVTARKLREAGVRTVEDLRGIEVQDIAKRTGIKADTLQQWRDDAARLLSSATETGAQAIESAASKADEMAVVLRDRATTAKVRVEGVYHENLPIITAKLDEDQLAVARGIQENAVLLKEKADTAWVQIEGEWHKNVPIFKERIAEGERAARGAIEEVRVFVKEIREHPAETLKPANLLDRLLGKKA